MKNPEDSQWGEQKPWSWDVGRLWVVMEFKYHPRLKEDSAEYDISKFQDLKRYDENIERVYFFSIDRNKELYRYVNYRGKWFENYYREGRGMPDEEKEGEWNFFLLQP